MGSVLTNPRVVRPFRSQVGKHLTLRSILGPSLPITILLFCGGFNYAYVNWVSPTWSYLGLTYNSPDTALMILGYAFALVLSLLSPRKIRRPSHVIYWFCFFAVFVPGLFIPLYLQLENSFSLLLLQLSLSGGMLLIALSYRIKRFAIRSYPLDSRLFWTLFFAVYIVGNIVLSYAFQGMFRLVSLGDVYSVRTPAKHILESAPAVAYISQLLANVMNPFLMGYGVFNRRPSLFVIGTLGDILIYSTAANKLHIVAPIAVVIFYFTLKRDRGGWVPTMAMMFAAMFCGLTMLAIGLRPGPLLNIVALLLLRTFTVPGAEMGEYQHFFSNMPHTYLAHVTGINHFLPNPYALSLGEEIGSYFRLTGKYGLTNANASFFAMDGIGGFGLGGILVMGVLCALVFWVLDSCARNYELRFSVPLLAMVIMSLTNVSLFTTLLGNGLIIWMVLFIVMPREMRIQPNEGASDRHLAAPNAHLQSSYIV